MTDGYVWGPGPAWGHRVQEKVLSGNPSLGLQFYTAPAPAPHKNRGRLAPLMSGAVRGGDGPPCPRTGSLRLAVSVLNSLCSPWRDMWVPQSHLHPKVFMGMLQTT